MVATVYPMLKDWRIDKLKLQLREAYERACEIRDTSFYSPNEIEEKIKDLCDYLALAIEKKENENGTR